MVIELGGDVAVDGAGGGGLNGRAALGIQPLPRVWPLKHPAHPFGDKQPPDDGIRQHTCRRLLLRGQFGLTEPIETRLADRLRA